MKYKMIVLGLVSSIILACVSHSGVETKFQGAKDSIQSYAESHIKSDWFSFMEPVGRITVTDSEIKKITVTPDDDRIAVIAVLLKGYYMPMASTDEKERKKFSLNKDFRVTLETYGKDAEYTVKLAD